MKDIQKIKEFFSKPLNEGNEEYFKPVFRKDKSYPDFLYVDIAYPAGSDVLSVGGSKTMGGQDREEGAAKALSMGNMIVKKLDPFVVKLGEPLVQVVPFQRQSVLGVTRPTNEKDLIRTNNLMKQLKLKFFGTKIFFHKPKKFRIEHINERENYIAPTFIEREEREHFF